MAKRISTRKTVDWQAHIAAWKNSNLSQAEYCRRNNLKVKAFYYQREKLQRAQAQCKNVEESQSLGAQVQTASVAQAPTSKSHAMASAPVSRPSEPAPHTSAPLPYSCASAVTSRPLTSAPDAMVTAPASRSSEPAPHTCARNFTPPAPAIIPVPIERHEIFPHTLHPKPIKLHIHNYCIEIESGFCKKTLQELLSLMGG